MLRFKQHSSAPHNNFNQNTVFPLSCQNCFLTPSLIFIDILSIIWYLFSLFKRASFWCVVSIVGIPAPRNFYVNIISKGILCMRWQLICKMSCPPTWMVPRPTICLILQNKLSTDIYYRLSIIWKINNWEMYRLVPLKLQKWYAKDI